MVISEQIPSEIFVEGSCSDQLKHPARQYTILYDKYDMIPYMCSKIYKESRHRLSETPPILCIEHVSK